MGFFKLDRFIFVAFSVAAAFIFPQQVPANEIVGIIIPFNIFPQQVPANETVANVIPLDSNGDYEKCSIRNLTTNKTMSCDQGWTYGSEFESTILSEVNICKE
jgi:hypothetical protein